ncbi:MAG: hypothetical protein GEU88_18805, partial [Solirubrobacterales bacterium]|nr:hypothetical protein [Solirubrobacterales bacterium]
MATHGASKTRHRQSEARRRLRELGEGDPREVVPLTVGVRLADGERGRLAPEALLRDCVVVEPALCPLFVLWMSAAGASRRGERTFLLQAAKGAVEIVLEVIPRGIVMTPESLRRKHTSGAARTASLGGLFGELGLAARELDHTVGGRAVDERSPCAVVLDATRDGRLRVRV